MDDEHHNRTWLDGDIVSVLDDQHRLPKNPEKWLPKFNPDDEIPVEYHIKSFKEKYQVESFPSKV